MDWLRGTVQLAVLAVALLVAAPSVTTAQDSLPQCSDGVDNDGDNAVDGVDAGCGDGTDDDEADSIYAGIVKITIPLPVVTLQGTVDRKGVVAVSRLTLRALPGSTVAVSCKGKHCPVKTLRRTMIRNSLRLSQLEGRLRPAMTLELRVARPGQLGKYVRYKLRKRKPPKRFDSCLDGASGQVKECFEE